jgi:hypothetical protein
MPSHSFDLSMIAEKVASEVFALGPEVKSVILCSNLEIIKKHDHGPSRRKTDRLLENIRVLIANGDENSARQLFNETSWTGPQGLWWLDSVKSLTQKLSELYTILHSRRKADAYDYYRLSPSVAYLCFWEDR